MWLVDLLNWAPRTPTTAPDTPSDKITPEGKFLSTFCFNKTCFGGQPRPVNIEQAPYAERRAEWMLMPTGSLLRARWSIQTVSTDCTFEDLDLTTVQICFLLKSYGAPSNRSRIAQKWPWTVVTAEVWLAKEFHLQCKSTSIKHKNIITIFTNDWNDPCISIFPENGFYIHFISTILLLFKPHIYDLTPSRNCY